MHTYAKATMAVINLNRVLTAKITRKVPTLQAGEPRRRRRVRGRPRLPADERAEGGHRRHGAPAAVRGLYKLK